MTDTPLDLAAIEARAVAVAHHRTGPGRCACGYDAYKVGGFFPDYHAMLMSHLALAPRTVTPANTDDVLALVAALRDARGEVASLKVQQAELAVDVGDLTRDEQAYHDRALTAEAQVAAVLALCDDYDVAPRPAFGAVPIWRLRRLLDRHGPAVVPMSPNTGHDLRERIAQRIDQAWAEANDRRPRSEYREGYLDGLQHAEAVARITPLTIGVAPLDVEAPQYDRIESRGRKS